MAAGWSGDRVRLVPLDRERHLENALAWFNDPQITAWTLMGDLPITRLAEEEFFDRMSRESERDIVFAVELLESGEHIGFCGLHQIEPRNGVATTGTILGRTDLWGQGYGTDAVCARTRYAFDVLGLRMLLASVLEGNHASQRMLEKAGYVLVGRLPRRRWKRGGWRDELLLVCENAAWGPLRSA